MRYLPALAAHSHCRTCFGCVRFNFAVFATTIVFLFAGCGGDDGGNKSAGASPSPLANAPVITAHPANQTVTTGQTATFSVTASGTNLQYQWRRNGSNISGATSSSYQLATTNVDNGATFSAVVSNAYGSVASNPATLIVNATGGPDAAFTQNPVDATVTVGQIATFSVAVTGSPTPALIWQRSTNGTTWTTIAGATGTTYSLTTQKSDDSALFRAVATNMTKTATSAAAMLFVYPATGNPDGHFAVPAAARAEDVSTPDRVVGNGTPESCTAEAFISAVAQGGKITFNGGTKPFTIVLTRPAKVFNNKPNIVIDGGGLVTLSGGGTTRILYMNTCDPDQVWTTNHCQDQATPTLTVQNLTFIDGNSIADTTYDGGGAIWVRGGRFKIVNCRFLANVCAGTGPDVGGAAVRVFSQYQNQPVYVVNSTFGGSTTYANIGSNGGGVSSIGVNWAIYNCLFSYNRCTGNGANPAQPGTPGGGSGGAIYMDGNSLTLSVYGTLIENNQVNAHGSAIFFICNDHIGTLHIEDSTIRNNTGGSWYALPGISMHSDTRQEIINSVLQ
ncbi:MAG: immunoglobulin domain-containing protein [Nibricoccus sp.]